MTLFKHSKMHLNKKKGLKGVMFILKQMIVKITFWSDSVKIIYKPGIITNSFNQFDPTTKLNCTVFSISNPTFLIIYHSKSDTTNCINDKF